MSYPKNTTNRNRISSPNQPMWFGKHHGKSVKWVVRNDPSYILWVVDETDIEVDEDIAMEAQARFDEITFGDM